MTTDTRMIEIVMEKNMKMKNLDNKTELKRILKQISLKVFHIYLRMLSSNARYFNCSLFSNISDPISSLKSQNLQAKEC